MATTLHLTTPDGAVAQALVVPTQWADISFKTYCELVAPEEGDERSAAEILLGLPAGGLGQLAAVDVPLIANLLEFSLHPEDVTQLLPPPGQNYDVSSLPYGCLLLAQQHFEANAERPMLASLPYVLAVYRCQLTWGNTDRLAAVLAAPVTEVFAEAQSFTARCKSWLSSSAQPPKMPVIMMTPNWRRAPLSWLKNMARRFRSTRWPAATS